MAKAVPIQRSVSLRGQVSEAVLEMLRAGLLAPGARVTEEALAQRFQVSRTPIREALVWLAQRGVLERRRSGGYCVPQLSPGEVKEIIAVRMLLEPAAVRMAVDEFGAKDLVALERTIAAQASAVEKGDAAKFATANEDFHKVIFGAVPNKVLRKAIAQFDPHVHLMRAIGDLQLSRYGKMLERQAEIKDAITRKNGERAEILWKNYLHHTQDWLVDTMARSSSEQGGDSVPDDGAGA